MVKKTHLQVLNAKKYLRRMGWLRLGIKYKGSHLFFTEDSIEDNVVSFRHIILGNVFVFGNTSELDDFLLLALFGFCQAINKHDR